MSAQRVPEIWTWLGAVERRRRWLTGLRAAAVAAGGAAIVLGVLAAVFRLAHPAPDVLLALAAATALAACAWAAWWLRGAFRPADERRLARFVEERRPEFEDALVTAVQVREGSHVFARAIAEDAAACARTIEPSGVIGREELHRAAAQGAAACALLLVTAGASVAPFESALGAARVWLFPSRVAIAVEPGNARVPAGTAVTLRAHISGMPAGVDPQPTVTIGSGPSARKQAMRLQGGSYVLTIPRVDASFTYGVRAAGIRSPEFTVTVLHVPVLQRIDLSYAYPAYTGMPAREEEDGGDIYAPAGTRVRLVVRSDKPLSGGVLIVGKRTVPLEAAADPRARATTIVVDRDSSYRVDLVDTDGLRSPPSSEYFVRVTDDRPPEVRIVRPEGDRQVMPLEEVEIEARAEDDYRLASLELVYALGSGPERVVPLSRASDATLSGAHLLYLEDLHARPGDIVRAYARAREARKGGREARSEMLLLDVTPFDQQFSLAQSQAGAARANASDLDSLIQAEKNILNATWNLLRRSAAGRSDADVKALAGAQEELQRRVDAQTGGRREPRAGGGPLAEAAAAMERAAGALGRRRLADAVPFEMDALTALGRAAAENRQRQVMQQRGGGGGGGNRSSEDLSALFDRELLRQQQTNYENRQSSSSERREAESDLQKRIRELAARQDELARAQRELARQQLAEAERRRQLERLTREQEELRRQAEQLARDLQRQRGAESREQSERVRDAADDMRAATGELRRDNASQAGERGSRAAERLRRAEPSPGGEGEAPSIGELQMEAQQLAEAQRRMEARQRERGARASAPDRGSAPERPGEGEAASGQGAQEQSAARPGTEQSRERAEAQKQSGEADAGQRRLAAEQERLADRAERLETAARALASGGRDEPQRQAAGQAARELQRERVAGRMRENARRLQGGAAGRGQPPPGEPGAGEQKELSSTLDRVAERLGAAGDAETRRLAAEMARNRAAREQLEETARRLERARRDGDANAQEELRREMDRVGQTLREMQRSPGSPKRGEGGAGAGRDQRTQESGLGESTPEQHEWSRAAPGLESFKQDFSRWEELKRDLALALERRDLALAQQLRRRAGQDAVNAGSVEGLSEEYRAKVARYFEALARAGRKPR